MAHSIIIPSNPNDLKKLKEMVRVGSNSLARIDGEKEQLKDVIEEIAEQFDLPKKYVSKLISTDHKRNFDQLQSESEDFNDLYEAVFDVNDSNVQS